MVSLEFFIDIILLATLRPWGRFRLLIGMTTSNISWRGKGGWWIRLTTLPRSCAECLEIWDPQPPGSLRVCPGLHRDCFTFTFHNHQLKSEDCVAGPRSLNLELSLATFSSYLAEKLEDERRRNAIGGSSHVILVLGYGATISNSDHTQSARIIARFKQENPGNGTLVTQ